MGSKNFAQNIKLSNAILFEKDDAMKQVFINFQDFLFKAWFDPTCIITVQRDGKVERTYPSDKFRGFCDFCKQLRINEQNEQNESICIQEGNDFVINGVHSDDEENYPWGWRRCHMGLLDLYIPIHLVDQNDEEKILSVLCVGQFRSVGKEDTDEIKNNIRRSFESNRILINYPHSSKEELYDQEDKLLDLVSTIPQVEEGDLSSLQNKYHEAVIFFEKTASVLLKNKLEDQKQELMRSLNIEDVNEKLDETQFWMKTESILTKILDFFPLKTLVVYSSRHNKYSELNRIIYKYKYKKGKIKVPKTIGFPSPQSFNSILNSEFLLLPNEEVFYWLDPKRYFNSENAILFGKQTTVGRSLLFAFGFDNSNQFSSQDFLWLNEVIKNRFYDFVERSLYGLEMDYILSETGHLLGRAWGSAMGGYKVLKKIIKRSKIEIPEGDKDLYSKATWAIQDGLFRLDIIKQNFYLFNKHNNNHSVENNYENLNLDLPDGNIHKDEHPIFRDVFDVIEVIGSLKDFFWASVEQKRLITPEKTLPEKLLFVNCDCEHVLVNGYRDSLRLVLLNLFDNALKFSYKEKPIYINVQVIESTCIIQFKNIGLGVPKEEKNFVFEPYVKSRIKDPVKLSEGLGLGLSFCRRVIIEEFNGSIELESYPKSPREKFEGDNWETIVTIELPIYGEESC